MSLNFGYMRGAGVLTLRSAVTVLCLVAACAVISGCASEAGSGGAAGLPSVLGSRWTPPAFARRVIETDRARQQVFDACVTASGSLGYTLVRADERGGTISAARRQTAAFDGARQDSIDIKVVVLDGGAAEISIVIRETVESGAGDERAGGFVSGGIVRDRAAYDAFFERFAEALRASAS